MTEGTSFTLNEGDYLRLERDWRSGAHDRFSIRRADDVELAAMADECIIERALYLGDIAAGDFTDGDEATLRNGIALIDYHLDEIATEAERRLRARVWRGARDGDCHLDWKRRFDAMRHADIVGAIQTLGTPLQQRGREWWGLCPFHEERTPSFAVNREKGLWRCHGCLMGGDLVTFAAQKHRLTPIEALRLLEAVVDVPGVAA